MKQNQIDFLNKIAPMAVADWNKNHIVIPSITIAQGLRESGWGGSVLAVNANNLFGIKADNSWKGRIYNKVSGEYKSGSTVEYKQASDFRAYDNWSQGIEDHSKFLTKARYAGVKGQTDFTFAAHALKMANYATGPYYSLHLVQDILDYKLYKYDPIQPNFEAIYRVQTNAFSQKENGEKEVNKLRALGYNPAFIYDEKTKLYHVQIGAYRSRDKAVALCCDLILQGYKPILKIKE